MLWQKREGGREDRTLELHYSKIYDTGTQSLEAAVIASCITSRQLKLERKSQNITGLQIAEILGQPCFRSAYHLRSHGGLPTDYSGTLATLLVQQGKYRQCPVTKNIDGFGRRWLP